jgi:serine/threonine protein kinase
MNATSLTQQSPRSFGAYRLVRKLGSGGYGTTFLVEREFANGMTKQFALKRLSVQPEDRTSRQAEFRDEARLLMLIDKHPGIVQLVDYFPEDDEHVLVMEYVHGVDLQALLNQLRSQHPARRLPHFVSMYITAEICSALAHAHGLPQQVVHRDIAPANVFLGFDGHVKLGDFGIATFIGRPKHTSTTEVKGRLSYMSPEHIDKSLGLDARSDLFSLGGMLYLLLSGHLPFPGPPSEAMPAILKGRITPISTHVPDVDPALAELVHELLCADKALRPSDAQNVRARPPHGIDAVQDAQKRRLRRLRGGLGPAGGKGEGVCMAYPLCSASLGAAARN